jgi:hypothetical protein
MASFEVVGALKAKFETQQVSDKFAKREFVIMTDTTTQYPQAINFQLSQDKCGLLDSYNVGEEMKVSFNLRGREWFNPTKNVTQYFNSLEAWRLEKVAAGTQAAAPQQQAYAAPTQAEPVQNASVMPGAEIADDLPF